ncbi:MAG: lysozyme inhibitor LprI family protein [Pseudomonadota bacterium]
MSIFAKKKTPLGSLFCVGCSVLFLALPGKAQDFVFEPSLLDTCLAEGSEDLCIGVAARACIAGPGGTTTVGLGYCFDQELSLWDGLLNRRYQALRQRAQSHDEALDEASFAPKIAPQLLAMQRAWLAFRAETCAFERVLWGGGTGGGPAMLNCLMEETARQAIRLGGASGWMEQ